ncbi:MAG: FecR domain-containing protein [Thermoguttaceae bacterium]|jgi:ferric-dicitrate binding protein FerR (iron transport regulator)
MNNDLEDLVDRYLDGSASDQEVQRLDQAIRQDPAARKALLMSAAMQSQLGWLLATPPAGVPAPPASRGGGPRRRYLVAAAAVAAAAAGWLVAILLAGQYRAKCGQYDAALRQLAAREAPAAGPDRPEAQPQVVPAGRVVQIRGLVLAFPKAGEKGVSVSAGSAIPMGTPLWTCPWGSAAMRFADGTWMNLDRSTEVQISQADAVRKAAVKRGILFVTTHQAAGQGKVVVTTANAAVTLVDGQAAVAVDGDRTIVEVAMGHAGVSDRPDGPAVPVDANQYAIVGAGGKPQVAKGGLTWRLAPAQP